MEWGPNIYTGQKRPEWLTDDATPLYWHDAGWQGGRSTAGQLEWVQGGDPLEYIQLPADHFANLAIARGFTPWFGGDGPPEDWDKGEVLIRRDYVASADYVCGEAYWRKDDNNEDIIGYHPKLIAQPLPADTVMVATMSEDEAREMLQYDHDAIIQCMTEWGFIRRLTPAQRIAAKTGVSVTDVERVIAALGEEG